MKMIFENQEAAYIAEKVFKRKSMRFAKSFLRRLKKMINFILHPRKKMSEIFQRFICDQIEHQLTITVGKDGNALFLASEIGEILGIKEVRSIIRDYDGDQVRVHTISTNAGTREALHLTEEGVYRLIFASRKPIARPFQKWVMKVLKEINRTGSYSMVKGLRDEVNDCMKLAEEASKETAEAQEIARLALEDTAKAREIAKSAEEDARLALEDTAKAREIAKNAEEDARLALEDTAKAREIAKNAEKDARLAKHKSLLDAYHRKYVVYLAFIKIIGNKYLIKLGSTKDIKTTIDVRHAGDYGNAQLLHVIECATNQAFESFLLKHPSIAPYRYREPVKLDDGTSYEVFLVDDDEINMILRIAKTNLHKFRDTPADVQTIYGDLHEGLQEVQERQDLQNEAIQRQNRAIQQQNRAIQQQNLQNETIIRSINELRSIMIREHSLEAPATSTEVAVVKRAPVVKRVPVVKRKRVRTKGTGICCDCESAISKAAVRCQACVDPGRRFEVTAEELNDLVHVKRLSYVFIGKHFGVSDNAVRKRCITLGVKIRRPGDK